MSLANLFEVPNTPEEFDFFGFSNSAEHKNIVTAIQSQKGLFVNDFVISPIPLFDLPNWLRTHQVIHNEINTALGTVGNDLTDVDFRNRDSLTGWIELHAAEHRNFNAILGI